MLDNPLQMSGTGHYGVATTGEGGVQMGRSFMRAAIWLAVPGLVAGSVVSAAAAVPRAQLPAVQITAFPSPGDGFASPTTQLTFRGADSATAAETTVTGSHSGPHGGSIQTLPDGRGAIFDPAKPFTPGETITVDVGVPIRGDTDGTYTFRVAEPAEVARGAGKQPSAPAPQAATAGCTPPTLNYDSRPDLKPIGACTSLDTKQSAPGYLFTTSNGSGRRGETIYTNDGVVIWHKPESTTYANNFQVVTIGGKQRLVYFTGTSLLGGGGARGVYIVLDEHYREIGRIQAGNNYQSDLHELQITPDGTALIGSYAPVHMTVGNRYVVVYDYVVQEVDFQHDGAVLFEWHALDHVPVQQSHAPVPAAGGVFDYFHGNSIDLMSDGNLLISGRNTWGIYKVSRTTGRVMWTLGMLGNGPATFGQTLRGSDLGWFCLQHDAREQDNGTITVFDNGGAGPGCSHPARALTIRLDQAAQTATAVNSFRHDPDIYTAFTGNNEAMPNGNRLVSWGNARRVTEFSPNGTPTLDMSFGQFSYRTYRSEWHGYPLSPPDAVVYRSGTPRVHVSWNGATEVARWQLLGGPNRDALRPIGDPVAKRSFETSIPIPAGTPLVAVQALDSNGNPLAVGRTQVMAGSTFFEQLGGWTWKRDDYRTVVGDFDATHDDDVLFYTPGSGPDYLMLSDGNGGWLTPKRLPPIARTWTPLVGNFTGDVRDEIIWWRPGERFGYLSRSPFTQPWHPMWFPTAGHALVLRHNGTRGGPLNDEVLFWGPDVPDSIWHFAWPAGSDTVSTSQFDVPIRQDYRPISGDFDGNGFADVLLWGPGDLPDWTYYLGGRAGGPTSTYQSRQVHLSGTDYQPVAGYFGPVDPYVDVLFYRPGSGTDWLWRGGSGRGFSSTDVTNGESGQARRLRLGGNDVVSLWRPGNGVRLWRFAERNATPVVEGAGNPARGSGYRLAVGDFVGDNADSLYWFGLGDRPEGLWRPYEG